IHTANPLNLAAKTLEIDPYVLGFWLGDGTSNDGSITCADYEVIEQIERAGYCVSKQKRFMGYGVLGLRKQLRQHGLIRNKHVPAEYLRASIGQRLELLRGLMDSDGECSKLGLCVFSTTSVIL